MRISGSGIAHNGMAAIKRRTRMFAAKAAISVLHDALLAVARGELSPAEVRDFFWHGDALADVRFFGDVLEFARSDAPVEMLPADLGMVSTSGGSSGAMP